MNDVEPWAGLPDARFGETREALRDRFGEHSSFRRGEGEPLIDHYVADGLLLGFDQAGTLAMIEGTKRSGLSLAGVRLVGRPFGGVLEDLAQAGFEAVVDDSGCILEKQGIALYTAALDEPEEDVEGAAVFSRASWAAHFAQPQEPGSTEAEIRREQDEEKELGDTLF
jgi:hypothetical protein